VLGELVEVFEDEGKRDRDDEPVNEGNLIMVWYLHVQGSGKH